MSALGSPLMRARVSAALCVGFLTCFPGSSRAQAGPAERTFRVPKGAVEKALKQLQPATSGRLPALEGFALVGNHPLSRYQRGFYQCAVLVTASPSGESVVRITAKVTAWYADPDSSHSGYELLRSNGRIEADLLDQLSDQLSSSPSAGGDRTGEGKTPGEKLPSTAAATAKKRPATDEPTLSAPMPRSPETSGRFPAALGKSLPAPSLPDRQGLEATLTQKERSGVRAEIATLEEVVKSQAHPKNLVAVKKSGTPVVASPSLSGKTLFMASAHDEFEMLDYNNDWVHVRISGLSRGWIWRTSLEMPENIPDVPQAVASSPTTAADLFQVSREETAPFPGDWEPLRGKSVKIISVQKIRENEHDGGPGAKLEFAKSLLDKTYAELAKSPDLAGLVLIFDSADGGMIAAALPTIQRWKAGTLSDAALWHQCYFDPPETFTVSSAAGSR